MSTTTEKKPASRKYQLTYVVMAAASLVPIAYQAMKIPESITMTTLMIIGGIGGSYQLANVVAGKKVEPGN